MCYFKEIFEIKRAINIEKNNKPKQKTIFITKITSHCLRLYTAAFFFLIL